MPPLRWSLAGPALYAAALALAAACASDSPERCFEPDATAYQFHDPLDPSAVFHWTTPWPVRIYAEPVGALRANTDTAVAIWLSAFRCGELSLRTWSDSGTADIVVRNPPAQPVLTARAHTFAADSINACAGVTTSEPWDSTGAFARPIRFYVWPMGADSAATEACYRFVTLHELGHALGLLMHSTDTLDIMHSRPRRRALSVNDRYTIQVLYSWTPTLHMVR